MGGALPGMALLGALLLLLLLLLLGDAAASAEMRQLTTYVAAFDEPRLSYTLHSFMSEPGAVLKVSQPAYALELVAESCAASETVELRELLFLQSVAVASQADGTGITMLYAGMEDGRFVGYYDPERYTFRAADWSVASSPDHSWSPYASADDVPGDAGKGGAQGLSLAVSCPGAAAPSAEPACTPAGCCDRNIRTYHDTSLAARGAPQTFTGWTLYDPRVRPWYIEEMARSDSPTGWSSVYVFSGSGNLGITRTAKMTRDSASTQVLGVLAADFELGGLSSVLNETLAGDGSWAFIVERSGSTRGKLLATSFGAPLRLESGERSDLGSLSGEGAELSASIATAARSLEAEGLPATAPGEVLTNTVPGRRSALTPAQGKFEAVAVVFELGGLDWLVVVGQDIVCAANEVWEFGKCKACPEGQVPGDDRSCVLCASIHPGTITDDGVEGGIGTQCVCPPLTYAVRTADGMHRCKPCSDLAGRVQGVQVESTEPIIWESPRVCPGGISEVTRICPVPNHWIETLELVQSNDIAETQVDLLTCPACTSGGCSPQLLHNVSQPSAVCRPNHKGFMSAACEEGYKAVEGQCTLCEQTDWSGIIVEVLTAVAIGFFLMSKTLRSVCSPADAEEVFKIMDSRHHGYLSVEDVRKLLIRMGNPVAASATFDETLAEMKAKQYPAMSGLRTRSWWPRWAGGIDNPDRTWVQHDSISKLEFSDWCHDNQNRATVGTYIFAVQTFGLVVTSTANFSALEIFNLDVGKAVKSCRSPECGLFCGMMTMAIVPVCAGIAIYIGMYMMATKLGKITSTDGTILSRGLPMRWHHLQRGYMQLYLFSFAPITRRCAELLMCRSLPKDGNTTDRLVTDLGLVCWEGPHVTAALIAVCLLLLYALVVPAFLLVRTSRHMRTRWLKEGRKLSQSRDLGAPSFCKPRSFLSSRAQGTEVLDTATLLRIKSTPTLNPKCKNAT
eukprot:COSAG02_NODE_68_length_42582_cov_52.351129_35_plen_961_part_00